MLERWRKIYPPDLKNLNVLSKRTPMKKSKVKVSEEIPTIRTNFLRIKDIIQTFSYKFHEFFLGSIISYFIGGFDLMIPFLIIWFSYHVFEDCIWELGLSDLGMELITLGCVLVGVKFNAVLAFIYSYLTVGLISTISKFMDPDSDEDFIPFGSYAFGYGVAAFSASLLKGHFSIPELLFVCAITANLGRILLDSIISGKPELIDITYVGNVMFNVLLGLFLKFLGMLI